MIEAIEAKGDHWPCDENVLVKEKYFDIFNKFCEKSFNTYI